MNAKEIEDHIRMLTLAIDDSIARCQNNNFSEYIRIQENKRIGWGTQRWVLKQRLALITNPKPVTGVISIHNVDIDYEWDNAINLSYEEAKQDHERVCDDPDCLEDQHELFFEGWEEDGADTRLLGNWGLNINEEYEPQKDPDSKDTYAAIIRETEIQVVWSETTTRVKSMCSPCFPGQADLDSGEDPDGILAYTLPKEMIR